jgi:hypothetical protein
MEYIGIAKPKEQITSEASALLAQAAKPEEKTIVTAEQLKIGEKLEVADAIEVKVTSELTVRKPKIDPSIELTKEQEAEVAAALKASGMRLIHQALTPAKNDYTHDFDRGTVKYTPSCRNYSFHKVIVPDGTTVKESNFSQREPYTDCIFGDNLTFESCNLVNVEIGNKKDWTVNGCNISQIKRCLVSESEKDGIVTLIISHQVENKEKEFVEVTQDKITVRDQTELALQKARLNEVK